MFVDLVEAATDQFVAGLVDMPAEATAVNPGDLVDFLPFTGLFA